MRMLFRLFIVLPVALLIILFAVANRAMVVISFDPFPGDNIAGPTFAAPLFLVMTLSAISGVIAGGVAVWFGQGRYRKSSRRARDAARRTEAEASGLRAQISMLMNAPPSSDAGVYLPTIKRDLA